MAGGRRRVLVIEDDPETAEQLVESLATNGYQVDLAVNGNDGLSRGCTCEYAVMTIDRMLPGIDGIAVIRRLREGGVATPALILSALGEVDDRVRGLRAGGDDYLVKPFAFAELLARIEALTRRSAVVVKETVLRVEDLELDLVSRTAKRSGQDLGLRPREFEVLSYLVRNQGQWYPGRCYCSTCGISISTLPRTSSMSTLDACAARSTLNIPIHSSTPCVASDSVSVLLAETLRSSTLKLALLAIGLFGTVMFTLIGYVYWSTISYVRNRSDPAIAAEQIALKETFERVGRSRDRFAQAGRRSSGEPVRAPSRASAR